MTQKPTFDREVIVDTAIEITRERGWSAVTARSIAKRLGSSTMPIYSTMSSMEEIEREVRAVAERFLISSQRCSNTDDIALNKAIGYVVFARDEPNLFRFLYVERPTAYSSLLQGDVHSSEGNDFDTLAETDALPSLREQAAVASRDSRILKNWIFAHGLAMLSGSGVLTLSDERIKELLWEAGAALTGHSGTKPSTDQAPAVLFRPFRFDRPHKRAAQQFEMTSRMTMKAPNGESSSVTTYRLSMKCVPEHHPNEYRYTCRGFTISHDEQAPIALPSLEGWSYVFKHQPGERDEHGRTLGIDHAPFEHLHDASGSPLSELDSYHVYNAFIDFHAFGVFSDPSLSGPGIQNLQHVGESVVHASSHSKPNTELSGSVSTGSWFQNGEVTLEFTGLGNVDRSLCAIISVDSGASSFRMLTNPGPGVELSTAGSSHYWATIFKDVDTMWIRRATLTELVVSETVFPGTETPVHGVAERSIVLKNVPVSRDL